MLSKYVFLGNCLTHPKCREAMIKYIQGRFKPGSEDNFINGLLGEYIAECYLKEICRVPLYISSKQEYIYSASDPHQYLEGEPDFWIDEAGYDVKSTTYDCFRKDYKKIAVSKAIDEGASYVVFLSNFNYHTLKPAFLSIETVDGQVVMDEVVIPEEFIQK